VFIIVANADVSSDNPDERAQTNLSVLRFFADLQIADRQNVESQTEL
jgi:hypothetical protein